MARPPQTACAAVAAACSDVAWAAPGQMAKKQRLAGTPSDLEGARLIVTIELKSAKASFIRTARYLRENSG
jgi:hypothetical protein